MKFEKKTQSFVFVFFWNAEKNPIFEATEKLKEKEGILRYLKTINKFRYIHLLSEGTTQKGNHLSPKN